MAMDAALSLNNDCKKFTVPFYYHLKEHKRARIIAVAIVRRAISVLYYRYRYNEKQRSVMQHQSWKSDYFMGCNKNSQINCYKNYKFDSTIIILQFEREPIIFLSTLMFLFFYK